MEKKNLENTVKLKEVMLRALEANFGNVTKAAKVAGITPRTHQRWCKEDNDYDKEAGSIKDLGMKGVKDNLIEMAMKSIEKGNMTVLNKMLGIFLKNMPEEMKALNRYNNPPLRVGIKYAPHPSDFWAKDPATQAAAKQWLEEKERKQM